MTMTMTIKKSYSYLLKLSVCFSLLAVSSAYASQYNQETTETEISTKNQSIEKIEVLGQRPVSYFKREMFRAQKLFLKNYNNLTTNSEFKTRCFHYMPKGTLLRQRTCEARFVRTKRAQLTQDAVRRRLGFPSNAEIEASLRETQKEYKQDMIKVIIANPELRQHLSAYAASVALFRKKRQEKHDKAWTWN